MGSLKASALLVQAKILPILTYGTEAWLNVSKDQYAAMETILCDTIVRIISLPKTTNYEALLLEMANYHVEAWIDAVKIKYFMKKNQYKQKGKLYRILLKEIVDKTEDGFIGNICPLCEKYDLPDATLFPLKAEDITYACKWMSRGRAQMVLFSLKKVPPLLIKSKVWNVHFELPIFEARAITALRTGNLVFKNWCPWEFSKKNSVDKLCMKEDSLKHVMQCPFYTTRFYEGGEGPASYSM